MDLNEDDVSFSFFSDNIFQRDHQNSQIYSPQKSSCSNLQNSSGKYVCRKLFEQDQSILHDREVPRRPTTENYKRNIHVDDGFAVPEQSTYLSQIFQSPAKRCSNSLLLNSKDTIRDLPITKLSCSKQIPYKHGSNTSLAREPLLQQQIVPQFEIKEEIMSPFVNSQHIKNFGSQRLSSTSYDEDKLMESMLQWMYSVGLRDILERQCHMIEEEEEESCLIYKFKVMIDIQQMINISSTLGTFLMQSPVVFTELLKKVCFDFIKSDGMVRSLDSYNQLIIIPVLSNVPATIENTIETMLDLRYIKGNPGGIFRLRGLVIGMSTKVPYTLGAKYKCPEEDCELSAENYYIATSSLGTAEPEVIRTDWPCSGCGSILNEDISKRIVGEKRYCFVIPKEGSANLHSINNRTNQRSQAIKVVLKDDLADEIAIGGCFWFTGIFRFDVTKCLFSLPPMVVKTYEAACIEKDTPFVNRVKNFQSLLPDPLCALYQDRRDSPWSFAASLAYCFLDSILPPGIHSLYKTLLLMSLVMQGDMSLLKLDEPCHKLNRLHILVEDEETLLYQQLMILAISYFDLSVVHRTPMDLFGCVTDDGNDVFINGGSLSIAADSVCIIPNLLSLKRQTVEKLQKAFESNQITMTIPSRQHKEIQQTQIILPFESTVWTCCETQRVMSTNNITHKEISVVSHALAGEFNLVLSNKTNKWDSVNVDDLISAHILQRSVMSEHTDGFITHNHMKEPLLICSSRKVDVT